MMALNICILMTQHANMHSSNEPKHQLMKCVVIYFLRRLQFIPNQSIYPCIYIMRGSVNEKTRPVGGDRPHGITLRRRPSHTNLENPRTLPHPYGRTQWLVICEKGRAPTMLWTWDRRGDFFCNAQINSVTSGQEIRSRWELNSGQQGAQRTVRQTGLARFSQ